MGASRRTDRPIPRLQSRPTAAALARKRPPTQAQVTTKPICKLPGFDRFATTGVSSHNLDRPHREAGLTASTRSCRREKLPNTREAPTKRLHPP